MAGRGGWGEHTNESRMRERAPLEHSSSSQLRREGQVAREQRGTGATHLRPAGDALHSGVGAHQRQRGGAQRLAVGVELHQDAQPRG